MPNDDEDLVTGKNLKSVMERLYLLASKGSGTISFTYKEELSIGVINMLVVLNRDIEPLGLGYVIGDGDVTHILKIEYI